MGVCQTARFAAHIEGQSLTGIGSVVTAGVAVLANWNPAFLKCGVKDKEFNAETY